jgi:hypothetical protein
VASIIVGTYDASTFVDGDYTTYPQLPPGLLFYQLGMGWVVTVAGTVQGQDAEVDDILFALPLARRYGDFTYGDKVYGSKSPNSQDWAVDEILFVVWDGSNLPPDQAPYPNAGCPITPDHGFDGNWAPGWRIVVDAYYDPRTNSRTYGQLNYGDEVYGTTDTVNTGIHWVDITQPSFDIQIGDGMADGGPRVVVAEVVVNFLDPIGFWFDMAEPQYWHQPQPGTPIRVGLLDPAYRYHPLITAEIERIEDKHDADIREVTVRGFGKIIDLVVDLNVQRPNEQASTRINWLASQAGWSWDSGTIAFPPGNAWLWGDKEPRVVTARDEIDRTCHSCGWFLDSDRRGRMRVRPWPHEPHLLGELRTLVNLVENPTPASAWYWNSDDEANQWNNTYVNGEIHVNRLAGAAPDNAASLSVMGGLPPTLKAGVNYQRSVEVWTDMQGTIMGNGVYGWTGGQTINPGWQRIVEQFTGDGIADTFHMAMWIHMFGVGTGVHVKFRKAQIVENPTGVRQPYFDGSTPDAGGVEYDWLGADNSSPSTATWTRQVPFYVADCHGYRADDGEPMLVSHSIAFANDESQLLNRVVTSNTPISDDPGSGDDAQTLIIENVASIGRYGRRGRAHNFPMTGLAWAYIDDAEAWARRVLNRYSFVTRQVESFEVDTAVDNRWLKTLADMDTGLGVQINRKSLTPMTFDGVIVGWRWRIEPGRWQGTAFVATITPTM